jgi:hypothetical protein
LPPADPWVASGSVLGSVVVMGASSNFLTVGEGCSTS